MSSQSMPPVSVITKDWDWLKTHILLLAVTGIFVVGSVYGVESLIARHDAASAAKYSVLLATQIQQTQAVEKQLATDEAHWTQVEQTLLNQNAQLSKTIVTENKQVENQRKADATLNAQQAAERLTQQTKAASGEVVASGDNVVVDLPITRSIVSDLDLLVGTQDTLKATQTQLVNETTIADNAKSDAAAKNTLITNLKAQNDAQVKSCDARIALVKAQARKGKLKWFVSGVVVGFIGKRLLLGRW